MSTMIKTAVICMNPFISHFTPTLIMAKRLRDMGFNVIYLGFAEMEYAVKNEGFGFLAMTSCENHELVELQKRGEYKKLEAVYKKLHQEIREHLEKCQANLIMIGISRFLIYLLPAIAVKAKVVFYSLCAGNPGFSARYPPVTSDYVPANGRMNRSVCVARWFGRYVRKGMGPRLRFSRLFYPWPAVFSLCKERGIRWRFGVDGIFPDYPVVVLGTKYMEFEQSSTTVYAGLCIEKDSNNGDIGSLLDFGNNDNPLVYCCLGTMSKRYRNTKAFLAAVIELFKYNPQWNLILSLGTRGETSPFGELTSNIHVVDYIPQLTALQHADLMLTHGGYGTVKECIYSRVPMIVFSCSYDQHGNAARVQYHQIGMKSSLLKKTLVQRILGIGTKKISPEDIKSLIENMLGQDRYKQNISQLRDRIVYQEEMNEAVKSLTHNIFI